jgi:hypothetical protein
LAIADYAWLDVLTDQYKAQPRFVPVSFPA